MKTNDLPVAREIEIAFDHISPLFPGKLERRDCILRRICRGTPVSHDLLGTSECGTPGKEKTEGEVEWRVFHFEVTQHVGSITYDSAIISNRYHLESLECDGWLDQCHN